MIPENQTVLNIPPGDAFCRPPNFLGTADSHNPTAFLAPSRSHVHDVIGVADQVKIMFDDDDRRPLLDEGFENVQEGPDVLGVEADGGLIEDEDRSRLPLAHFAGQLEPLGLSTGKPRSVLAQGQVAQP